MGKYAHVHKNNLVKYLMLSNFVYVLCKFQSNRLNNNNFGKKEFGLNDKLRVLGIYYVNEAERANII